MSKKEMKEERNNEIKAIIKTPDMSYGHTTRIQNDLKTLQKCIDGFIESVTLKNGVVILCDRDGLSSLKRYNCNVEGVQFFGTILAVGAQEDEFADIQITFQEWKDMLIKHK